MNLNKKVTALLATLSIFTLASCGNNKNPYEPSPYEPSWNPTDENESISGDQAVDFATNSGFPASIEDAEKLAKNPKSAKAIWDFSKSEGDQEKLLPQVRVSVADRLYIGTERSEEINKIGIEGKMTNDDCVSTKINPYQPISIFEIESLKDAVTFYLHKNTNLTIKIAINPQQIEINTYDKKGFFLYKRNIYEIPASSVVLSGEIKVAYTL